MTAWGLLIHAQLTHNLKIFLEKASKSLLESKLSQFSPGTQFYGSQLQTIPSGSLQSGNLAVPIADSLQPSVSDLVSACVSSAVYGTSVPSDRSALDMGKNICVTTDYLTGNRNVLGRETGILGMEESQVGNQVNGRTSKGIFYGNLPESATSQSIQVQQKIVAVPCQKVETVQKPVQNIMNADLVITGPFRSRSNTLPNITRLVSDIDSSQNVLCSQGAVDSNTAMISEKTADDQKLTGASPVQSRDHGAECMKDDLAVQMELGTENINDINLHEEGKSIDSALIRNILQVEQSAEVEKSADVEKSANNLDVTETVHKDETDNLELEKVETERNTEEQEHQGSDVDDESDKIQPCCNNQGCGITVIPGSHQILQKCCNAVVPKKRKRHFETKHMPFSWSSSRYAKRRLLQSSRDRPFPSCSSSKSGYNVQGGSTIYIDVEPESFVSSCGKSTSPVESTVQVVQSQFSTPRISTSERSSRPRSLILRPGAVFSIPLTYTIPVSNSAAVLMPGQVPQQPLASIPTESHDSQTGTQSLSVDTTEAVEQSADCSTASLVSTDNDSTDAFEVRQALDGESRRRKYPTSKPFKCEVCEVAFNQRIHLKKHMSKHTGVKPFKCGQCDYSTVERSHLKVHIRIHTGEKPFKCTFCEYATAQNSTLKIHLKRHHGGHMFQCPNCSKEFTQQTQLTDHEWEHSPPDNSSKQQANKTSACKTVMKTEMLEDQSSQQENAAASSSLLTPPLQQEALTVSNANVGHVTPTTNGNVAVDHVTQASSSNADLASHVTPATISSPGLGHVIPSVIDSEALSHVIHAANGSTDSGHVMLATNSSADLNHVIPVSSSSTGIGHVISIPSVSSCMTDNEAAVLLNSLTAKLLEEAEQAAQKHTD